MAKFRKNENGVVVDAFLPSGGLYQVFPDWLKEEDWSIAKGAGNELILLIKIPGRWEVVQRGDLIIRDPQGKLQTCKPDIFEATYEKVEP